MKTLTLLIALLSAAILAAGSSAPTYTIDDGVYEWSQEVKVPVPVLDTLIGTDSTVFINKYTFTPGWEYIFNYGVITGTGSDSVKIGLRVDLFDANKVFLYSLYPDSIAAATGGAVVLPIGRTAFAPYVTVKGLTYTGHGDQAILKVGYSSVMKRRPVVVNRQWE